MKNFTITGSDARAIMAGGKALVDLFAVKLGKKEPEDLSWKIPVQIGVATEAFNIRYWQHKTGIQVYRPHDFFDLSKIMAEREKVTGHKYPFELLDLGRGEEEWGFRSRQFPWMTGHPDGLIDNDSHFNLIDAKHTGTISEFAPMEAVVDRNFWQFTHYMAITGAEIFHTTVLYGNDRWAKFETPRNEDKIVELIGREVAFMEALKAGELPDTLIESGIEGKKIDPREKWDEAKLRESPVGNVIIEAIEGWKNNVIAAEVFEEAEKQIKDNVPGHVQEINALGVKITQARNGAKRIRLNDKEKSAA